MKCNILARENNDAELKENFLVPGFDRQDANLPVLPDGMQATGRFMSCKEINKTARFKNREAGNDK
jgi:hypothetical protein